MSEHDEVERSGSGVDRRTLIKRAAVAGAVAWTAPTIMQSVAGAQSTSPCSPFVTCTNFYSAKFEPAPCANAVCKSAGPSGVDPSGCGNPGEAAAYAEGCGKISKSCSGDNWTLTLAAGCRFIRVGQKTGSTGCPETPFGPCSTSVSFSPMAQLSHVTVYFCCNN